MSDNVVELGCVTRLDMPPERILDKAGEEDLKSVVIMGYYNDSDELYFASSLASGPEVLWLIERLKKLLLEVEEE
jgi:hypothetical protein